MCDMASSKVMSTTSPTNPDLPRQPSLCSSLSTLLADLQQHNNNNNNNNNININNLNGGGGGGDQSQNLGSMSMEDLLKNMYSAPPGPPEVEAVAHAPMFGGASISREGSFSLPKEIGSKSVDEVWKEIVAGGSDQRPEGEGGDGGIEGMTLEDFLTKAGAVREEDVRGSDQVVTGAVGYGVEAVVDGQYQVGFVNTNNGGGVGGGGRVVGLGGGGRGKRRAVEEPVLDKATQQKQRRMIKNRESAARSRERKQAYTVELESLVTQLEEENARLVREEAEQNKERFKQLMENLIPVVEKRRPPRVLRRVQSLHW